MNYFGERAMFGFRSSRKGAQVQVDYEKGRKDVLYSKQLSKRGRKMMCWLPIGLIMARAKVSGAERPDFSLIPDWASLAPVERKALSIAHLAMYGDEGDVIDAMTAHPHLSGWVMSIQHNARSYMEELGSKTLDRAMLDHEYLTDFGNWSNLKPYPHAEVAARLPHFIAVLVYTTLSAELRFLDSRYTLLDPGFEISISDNGFLNWLEEYRDPDFWPELIRGMNPDLDAALPVIGWIVQQPDCDRATAAMAFVLLGGDIIVGKSRADLRGQRENLCADICERAANGGYERQDFSLAAMGLAEDPSERIRRYANAEISGDIPSPAALFAGSVYGRAPQTPFYIHSEDTVALALI